MNHCPSYIPAKRNRWNCECVLDLSQNTHLVIATAAVELLNKRGLLAPNSFYNLLQKFKPVWSEGLFDADHLNPYAVNCSWLSHFWAPQVAGTTYPGNNYQNLPWPTAYSEFLEYDSRSRTFIGSMPGAVLRDTWQYALYYMGLALHYLTDLTQPMHANNLANSATDVRHKNYEGTAMGWTADPAAIATIVTNLNTTATGTLISERAKGTPSQIVTTTATEAFGFYKNLMIDMGSPPSGTAANAKGRTMTLILPAAILNTAVYVLNWVNYVNSTPYFKIAANVTSVSNVVVWLNTDLMDNANKEAATNCAKPKYQQLCAAGRPTYSSQPVGTNPYYSTAAALVACPYALQSKTCNADPTHYIPPNAIFSQQCAKYPGNIYGNYTSCDGADCTNGASCDQFLKAGSSYVRPSAHLPRNGWKQ